MPISDQGVGLRSAVQSIPKHIFGARTGEAFTPEGLVTESVSRSSAESVLNVVVQDLVYLGEHIERHEPQIRFGLAVVFHSLAKPSVEPSDVLAEGCKPIGVGAVAAKRFGKPA